MEISEKQIIKDYKNDLKEKTLKFGNIISIGALPALGYSIFQDIYIVNIKELAIWRVIALIPALIFLILSFTLFKKNNNLVIIFHCFTLLGIMIMLVGTNIVVIPGVNNTYKMGITGSSIVFIFIVFLFSMGARKYLIYIILIPLLFLFGFLLFLKKEASIDWPYFSNYGFISIAVIIMAFMAEKMAYNGFKMRKIAQLQKEISKSVKIEAEKSRLRAKDAEMANEIKNNFLAIMSHELRTPLNGIIGFTDILLKTENDKNKIDKLKIIQNSSDILLKLVNDLLDISRIESGNIEVKNETFDLYNILDNLNKVFSIQALKKNNKYIFNKDKNLSKYIIGDSLKLEQILSNIISNAIKFTDNGTIKFDVEEKLKPKNPEKRIIVFKIIDTGIGIKENKINKVFEKFTQGDNSTTRKYGGTGLGLSIVKELVRALKGKIEVESNPGYGSIFTIELSFSLPDKEIVDLIKQKKLKQNIIHDFSSFHVLIAEDNKFNQEVVKKMLEMKKCKVKVASTGFEVLDLLEKNQFDLILMDIEMPELNGYDTTIKIRESEKNYKDIPIIALTAYAMEKDKRECLKVGINEFLAKPIQIDSFYEIINKYKKI